MIEDFKKNMKTKIEHTEFEEEVRHLQAQISAIDTQGKAIMLRG